MALTNLSVCDLFREAVVKLDIIEEYNVHDIYGMNERELFSLLSEHYQVKKVKASNI